MAIILTKKNEQILVDDEDFAALNSLCWHVAHDGYVGHSQTYAFKKQRTILMHRRILGLEAGDKRKGDHKNRDKLDNRRENLRIATHMQNMFNATGKSRSKSGIKGVSFIGGKWRARIMCAGHDISLGTFESADLAKEFRDLAADMLHGEFARSA